jgi:hypothetical protein
MHNPGSNRRKYAQSRIPEPEVCTIMDPRASSMHNHGSQGRKFADVCKHSENVCKPRPAAAIPCGPVGIPSSDQRRPGQQLQSQREGTRCTTLDSRAGSLHNPGSNGRKYEVCRRLQTFGERLQTKASSCDSLRAGWQFDLVINAGPVCSCGPVLDAVPSIDTRGTYLQFPRVINADRASSCDPLRAGWQFDLVINAGLVLDAVPSIDQRRPGQQYAIPCEPVGVPSSDQRRPGQQYAQPWIYGPA